MQDAVATAPAMTQDGYLDRYVLVLRDVFLNDSLVLFCSGPVRHFGWTLGRIVDVLQMMMRVEKFNTSSTRCPALHLDRCHVLCWLTQPHGSTHQPIKCGQSSAVTRVWRKKVRVGKKQYVSYKLNFQQLKIRLLVVSLGRYADSSVSHSCSSC